jgi:predicted amidohydrolase YtcJ
MGGAQLPAETGDLHLERGAVKYMLDENALPDEAELIEIIRSAHASKRGVAFHCVTRSELVVALNAFERAGPNSLDRIEHASVTPPDLLAWMTQLPVAVITQPNFLRERGDAYLENVDAQDQPWLYRCAGFLKAGVPLAAGTDAPFGEPDPWAAMRAAVERRSAAGQPLGLDEALSPEQALGLFQSPLQQPGRGQAQISLGAPADLVLLNCGWTRARDRLVAEDVRATWVNGQKVWQRDA